MVQVVDQCSWIPDILRLIDTVEINNYVTCVVCVTFTFIIMVKPVTSGFPTECTPFPRKYSAG